MNEAEIRKGWLTGNAVIAFVGALFVGQAWGMAQAWGAFEGTAKLFVIFTVPNYSDFVIFLFIAVMFLLSLFLVLATIVTRLQRWAISIAADFSPVLGLFVWLAFFVSLLSAIPELPRDQWWSGFLIWGGIALLLFLLFYRLFDMVKSTGTKTNAGGTLVYDWRDIGGWFVPTLAFLASGRTLEVRAEGEIVNETSQREKLDCWRRKVMSAVQRARLGKSWRSNDEYAVSIGLRFHPGSHGESSFDIDNYTRPTINAIAAGLFSDAAPETIDHWHFPDSNFRTLLLHRLPDTDDAGEEGAAIFVSSWQKKPSLKERGQALLRALKKRGQALFRTLIEGGQALFRALLNRVRR